MPSTLLPSTVAMVVLMFCAHAHAECTMNTECKRDRICENGSCVDPSPATPPVTTATTPQATSEPTTAEPATAPPGSTPPPPAQSAPPRLVPHSEAMKGFGIVSVVLAGVALVGVFGVAVSETGSGATCGFGNIGSLGSNCGNRNHDSNDDGIIYGGLVSALVLTGVGIPLIVIGSRKEPALSERSATISPWVGRRSTGLSLRFDL